MTAELRDGVLSGTSGCNRYRTEYRVHGNALAIGGNVTGTLQQCAPVADALERA